MLLASLTACGGPASPSASNVPDAITLGPADPVLADSSAVVINATVRFLSLEGGCWALALEDVTAQPTTGRRFYQPTALSEEFRHDGLKVRAAIRELSGFATVCMIGPVVNVLWIRRR